MAAATSRSSQLARAKRSSRGRCRNLAAAPPRGVFLLLFFFMGGSLAGGKSGSPKTELERLLSSSPNEGLAFLEY